MQASALRRNLARIREAAGEPAPRVIAMVKADAYGLGATRAVQALEPAEPWGYGVATVSEGQELRAAGVERPIVVFSPLLPSVFETAVHADLTVALSDLSHVDALARAGRKAGREARFHLEVDTGMGRAGIDFRQVGSWAPRLAELPEGVRLTGCFTHFHSADVADSRAVRTQWKRFIDTLDQLPETSSELIAHACNSAGTLRVPEYARGAVRTGIFLYGGWTGEGLPEPEPVVTVRARVCGIREVAPGTTLGYGATHRAQGWERWATVSIGYGDGLPRALGNRGHALVRGARVSIIGRISMDLTVVDITGLDGVAVGDPVTFVGTDGAERITLAEVARFASTIDYEVLTGLSKRLPRVWIEDGTD